MKSLMIVIAVFGLKTGPFYSILLQDCLMILGGGVIGGWGGLVVVVARTRGLGFMECSQFMVSTHYIIYTQEI